tara:strand:+ start:642 stop:1613 length:972 start_codon:yes stop_codon:yes gene_type:complete
MEKMRKSNRRSIQKSLKKKTLIIGVTGQDGIHLSELLLKNNFIVYGSTRNLDSAKKKFKNLNIKKIKLLKENFFKLENTKKIIKKIKPAYIFFLGGQSSVGKSFKFSKETLESNIIPVANIIESIRLLKIDARVYNSSSSEIFGNQKKKKLSEKSDFFPISPYGLAKSITTELTRSYRESFNSKIYNGICFNHESLLRNANFLFGKFRILYENKTNNKKFIFGNLNIVRDWGLSSEYVQGYYKIIKYKKPTDFIIATGKSYSIKNIFIKILGKKIFKKKVLSKKKLSRKNEISYSYADTSKLEKLIKWKPKYSVIDLYKKIYE